MPDRLRKTMGAVCRLEPQAEDGAPRLRRRAFTVGVPAALAALQVRMVDWETLRPSHAGVVHCDRGVPDAAQQITLRPREARLDPDAMRGAPALDVDAFARDLHDALAPRAGGYSMQVRRDGRTVADQQFQWARTPVDGGRPWTSDTRMHVASISKLMTAIAIVHVCWTRGFDLDAPIAPALPVSWRRGPGIDRLTLRHLLTHTSGFHVPGSTCDYAFAKDCVAAGVAEHIGQRKYHNVNFGLCRVLLPILSGRLDPHDDFGSADDSVWDLQTNHHFAAYANAHVFAPSGVAPVGFSPRPVDALAYPMPVDDRPGWDSGDLDRASGGAGFRMAVCEVLAVMRAFRCGGIVPVVVAEQALRDRLGIDQQITTPAGDLFNKNGGWRRDGFSEQCTAFFAPRRVEIAVFVNSPLRPDAAMAWGVGPDAPRVSLRSIVARCYVDALRSRGA